MLQTYEEYKYLINGIESSDEEVVASIEESIKKVTQNEDSIHRRLIIRLRKLWNQGELVFDGIKYQYVFDKIISWYKEEFYRDTRLKGCISDFRIKQKVDGDEGFLKSRRKGVYIKYHRDEFNRVYVTKCTKAGKIKGKPEYEQV